MRLLTRLLQALLAVALLTAVFFWFAGRRGDRGDIEEEITIDRPAPAVFRWVSSDELLRRWISDLIKIESVPAGTTTAAQSRTVRMEQWIAGNKVTLDFRTTRVVLNQEIGWDLRGTAADGCRGTATFKLLSSGDYTRLTFSSHTEFADVFDQFFEPVWTFAARRKLQSDLVRLKLMMEAEPTSPADYR